MSRPRIATFPQIRRALRIYQICSVITGVGLLLLVFEMVLKYTPLAVEIFAGGSGGILWLAPVVPGADGDLVSTGDGLNISFGILVAHGWFYVVYLFACFRVWSLMRWSFWRFLLLAGGGVVPLLSFFMEYFVARDVKRYLVERENAAAAKKSAASATPNPNPSLSADPSAPSQEAAR